ncbi:hypothetical protein FisN_5Lh099 [Fistulifera solaris]|uniref:Uncharacterized protein n=1 Tax=Fistulifera solaris TaxID=1519565 RepID=A0A1Z5JJ78_FISSO|nr:hypothetical protein FisN_5Lh099 [Fistulifera solaris]|eukprot:GAX13986.1 hypothetical protein FisN_5Lh099 [Fistulifera solaris]
MTTNLQRLYTAAIALNNMAISFMERGLYAPASETLNSAAMLMKDISTLSLAQAACSQDDGTRQKIADMVRRAESYLGLSGIKPHFSGITLRVVNEDSAVSAVGATQSKNLTLWETRPIVVIRMEAGSIQDLRHRNPNVDSSFILYNLGCGQLCRACSLETKRLSHALVNNAQRLFLFSLTVLENVIADMEAGGIGNDESDMCYIVPAVILVLRSLTKTAFMLGQYENVKLFGSQADSFEEFFVEQTYLSLLFAPLSAAAAA